MIIVFTIIVFMIIVFMIIVFMIIVITTRFLSLKGRDAASATSTFIYFILLVRTCLKARPYISCFYIGIEHITTPLFNIMFNIICNIHPILPTSNNMIMKPRLPSKISTLFMCIS